MCPNLLIFNVLAYFMSIKVQYRLKVSAAALVHTLVSTVHTLKQHRLQMQHYQKADYAKPANVHVRRQTSLVIFSQKLYM